MKLPRLTILRGSAQRRVKEKTGAGRSAQGCAQKDQNAASTDRPVGNGTLTSLSRLSTADEMRGEQSAAGAGPVSVNGLSSRGERDRAVPEYQLSDIPRENKAFGGRGEIRTHETVSRLAVFKTAALNHSATLPALAWN
jgi:hypothetical protein